MKLSRMAGAVLIAVVCGLPFSTPASAGAGWFYPLWWDDLVRSGLTSSGADPDIITGRLLSTSEHWAGVTNYNRYCPTFAGKRYPMLTK